MSDFERVVLFEQGYDHREENGGVHGLDIVMLLKGEAGATQFRISTGWMLPTTVGASYDPWGGLHDYSKRLAARATSDLYPMPTDLGFHSRTPQYEGHGLMTDDCPYIGGPCYYDGSGLNALRIFDVLLKEGGDGVWRELEAYYRDLFESPAQVPA